ncbi:MAG: hypothetical protein RIF41_29045 [Polyangiaceae bacterium]
MSNPLLTPAGGLLTPDDLTCRFELLEGWLDRCDKNLQKRRFTPLLPLATGLERPVSP